MSDVSYKWLTHIRVQSSRSGQIWRISGFQISLFIILNIPQQAKIRVLISFLSVVMTTKISLHGTIRYRPLSLLSIFDASHCTGRQPLILKPPSTTVGTRDEQLLLEVSHCTGQPLYLRINMDI